MTKGKTYIFPEITKDMKWLCLSENVFVNEYGMTASLSNRFPFPKYKEV